MYCANVRVTIDAPSCTPMLVSFLEKTTSKTTFEHFLATVYRTFIEHDNDFSVNICKIKQRKKMQNNEIDDLNLTNSRPQIEAAATAMTNFIFIFLCSKIL